MNNSLISVFSALIFTLGLAVGGETGHTVQCTACQKTAPSCMFAASISQRVVSHQLKEIHVWTVLQFQMFVQWFHTPMQLDIMKNPLSIPYPLKKTFMSWPIKNIFHKVHNVTD
jgi:hypothetical protein